MTIPDDILDPSTGSTSAHHAQGEAREPTDIQLLDVPTADFAKQMREEAIIWNIRGYHLLARYLWTAARRLEASPSTSAQGEISEALKPFAEAANNYANLDDAKYIDQDATLTVGDLRNARAALEAALSGDKDDHVEAEAST